MNKNDKTLIILRSVSGAGKSTFADYLISLYGNEEAVKCEADEFFSLSGKYKFNASQLGAAHKFCFDKVTLMMQNEVGLIIQSNTNTRLSEYSKYLELAESFGYKVVVLTLNKHHGGKNQHGLNDDMIIKQADRFEHKLF